MDPIDRIDRATAYASDKIKGVAASDMSKPTPCPEFDVRALINHMLSGLQMLTTAAWGDKAAMAEGDQFVDDPHKVYEERRALLVDAVRSPGALERNWDMPFGTIPGSVMAQIAFMEHLTHGWDVAKATGQDTSMPAELVDECMNVVTPMDAMLRTPGVCGPAVTVPEGASQQDRLVGFLGRNP